MNDDYRISNEVQLREVIPEPNALLEQKIFDHVDRFAQRFIESAPLLFVSTIGPDGDLDVSPKGDAPGFVSVEDPKTLWIPERPGNKLAYGFRNMLAHPRVGLIFVIPGVKETLRINGSVEIWRDPVILEKLSAKNKAAILATRVTVDESFFHCGKALIRSSLWKPETWPQGFKADIGRQFASRSNGDAKLAKAIDEGMQKDYETSLY
jgi:PPOX class probable FMN-dependent enzyme